VDEKKSLTSKLVVTFETNALLKDTTGFEDCYELPLPLDINEKQKILGSGISVWMSVNGKIAGETYGTSLKYLTEKIEDCSGEGFYTIYCYSTTILPKFQGKHLSKILKAHWLGMCEGRRIVGHATSPVMVEVNRFFGAKFGTVHKNWYGTKRTAHFYHIDP